MNRLTAAERAQKRVRRLKEAHPSPLDCLSERARREAVRALSLMSGLDNRIENLLKNFRPPVAARLERLESECEQLRKKVAEHERERDVAGAIADDPHAEHTVQRRSWYARENAVQALAQVEADLAFRRDQLERTKTELVNIDRELDELVEAVDRLPSVATV